MNHNISEKDDKIADLQRLLLEMQGKQINSTSKPDTPAASVLKKDNMDGISISSSTNSPKDDSDISYSVPMDDSSMAMNSRSSSKRNAIDITTYNTRSNRARIIPTTDNLSTAAEIDLTTNAPPSSTATVGDMSL